jgi:hypothetical protein
VDPAATLCNCGDTEMDTSDAPVMGLQTVREQAASSASPQHSTRTRKERSLFNSNIAPAFP